MKRLKIVKVAVLLMILSVVIAMFFPTWTPKIPGENSISELKKIEIDGEKIEVMIRRRDRDNPVMLFVHGGPSCSEMPYIRKYQDLLDKDFTIVHYDQSGSGKSYEFGKDYSDVKSSEHVEDLISLSKYLKDYLKKDQLILLGHSYGTYLATLAASQEPKLYKAYIGIGQMSDTIESEIDSLDRCIQAAKDANNSEDLSFLEGKKVTVSEGEEMAPRKYVRKYGFAARHIDENLDYRNGFLFGSEYNFLDYLRYKAAIKKYQKPLIMEALGNPISDRVKKLNLPFYFVMGKYDGMTSPNAAENYLKSLGEQGQMVIFEDSAHYPQMEEKEKFYQWMVENFGNK